MNTLKTTTAGRPETGRLVAQVLYPSNRGIRDSEVRQHRNGMTGRAQAAANRRRSAQQAEMLIAENFRAGVDLYVTLTYEDNPADRDAALRYIQAFNKRMAAERRRRGLPYKYLYCTESRHESGRWHHHIIINRGPETIDELQALWGHGLIEVDRLRANYRKNGRGRKEKTFTNLAGYLCKEAPGKVGARQWNRSRNLRTPQPERDSVPESWQLVLPERAIPIDCGAERDGYGAVAWLKYWLPPEK